MGEWFVRPESARLELSDGQWIRVKRRLMTGEFRAHLKRSSTVGEDGVRRMDPLDHAQSLVAAFLVDWSLDAPIVGLSEPDLIALLDTLDPDRFTELKTAIQAHEAAMTAERSAEKNGTGGATNTSAISPSRSEPAGVSSGSES